MSKDETKPKAIPVDTVLSQLGSFGTYQLMTLALLSVPYILESLTSTHYVFSAYDVDYRCRIDECDGITINPAFNESWINITAPQNKSRQCYRYGSNGEKCSIDTFDIKRLVSCNRWVYEDAGSFVAEFNLACQSWKRTTIGTVRSIGNMIALVFSGQVSDRLGRKVVIYSAGTLMGLIGMAKTFSNSYVMFISLELLESIFSAGLYSAVFILSIELVAKEKRLLFQGTLGVIYSLAGAFYAVIAWKLPYWRYQLRVIYAPALLMIFYVFILDEGVRWLLSKGKNAKAIEIILKIAQTNTVTINNKTLVNLEYEIEEERSDVSPWMKTLKSGVMLTRLCICSVWWITCTFVYYGLTISSVTLGGNQYVDFALSSLVEIPGTIAVVFLPKKFGRKMCLLVSFFLGGALCIVLAFVPSTLVWLTTTTFLLGKLVTSFTFGVVYVYTSELFPTYTRNSMHSLCSCVGRLGAILAPQTPLLTVYMSSLPSILFGVCSLAAGLLTFLTPDTRRARLPDNVHQAENIDGLKRDADMSTSL